jgi:hypothetical protein
LDEPPISGQEQERRKSLMGKGNAEKTSLPPMGKRSLPIASFDFDKAYFIRKERRPFMPAKKLLSFVLPVLFLFMAGNLFADSAGPALSPLKVGDEAPWFTLPSSDDRLVDYYKDYYGKHHLVITFFPAAFTPV